MHLNPNTRVIAVTGTNGKSTTTALLGHVVEEAGFRVAVGGNIGIAAAELPMLTIGNYIFEISSYQIDLVFDAWQNDVETHLIYPKFDIAILLNLTPDHLDRHGNMQGYVAAKQQLFDSLDEDAHIIMAVDDEHSYKMYEEFKGENTTPLSAYRMVKGGIYYKKGQIFDTTKGIKRKIHSIIKNRALKGMHNKQNMLAVFACTKILGITPQMTIESFASYEGLPHRLQFIGQKGDISFYNDSKSTNADSTVPAVSSFQGPIYWIAGGVSKDGGISSLLPHLTNVKKAYLIGEAAKDFAATLKGLIETEQSGNMQKAVESAYKDAKENSDQEPIILLSPACASFDQYQDYGKRGEDFIRIVNDLKE